MLPNFVSDNNNVITESLPQNLNLSFLNNDSEIIDVNLSAVDHQNAIYAVSEMGLTPVNPTSLENISTNNHSSDYESSLATTDMTAELKSLGEGNRRYDKKLIERITNKHFNDRS